MKRKIVTSVMLSTIIAAVGGYFIWSVNGSDSGKKAATEVSAGISTDASVKTALAAVINYGEKSLNEKLTDLYSGTIVESETSEEETYIQEMVEAGEMSADVENEDIEELDEQMYAIQNVNLREGTAVTTTALRTIQFSEQVHVTGISTDKQWYRVEDTQEGSGYVASSYLSYDKPTQNASAAQQGNPDGGGDLTATKPALSGGNGGNGSGNSGGNGPSQSDLDALKAAIAASGSGNSGPAPYIPSAGDEATSNYGITMAQ